MSIVRPESYSLGSAEAGEIDLRQLAHALWRYRIAIFLLAFSCALIGAAASVLLTKQESSGLFLTPAVTLDAYKRYESVMASMPRLEEFLEASGEAANPAADLLRSAMEFQTFGQLVRPVFAFTDKDAKAYGVKVEEDESKKFVGIELFLSRKQTEGPAPVLVLAEFVRDVIIKTDLQEFTLAQCLANQTRDKELRNAQLDAEFNVAQERLRAENIRRIILSTPGAENITGLQTVSLENGAERFLSPAAQLVAAEIKISDLEIEQRDRDRDRIAAVLRQRYFCSANAALAERSTGQDFLARLDAIHAQAFAESDMQDSVVEETSNGLLILAQRWKNDYLQHMRFVTSPQGAEVRVRKFSPIVGALAGGIFGGITGVLLGLLLSWWRENRDAVIANP